MKGIRPQVVLVALVLVSSLAPRAAVRGEEASSWGISDAEADLSFTDMTGQPPASSNSVWGSQNEQPAQVRRDLDELEAEKLMASEFHPERVAQIERELARARLRLEIARKREERDRLKKQGRKSMARDVEREIHALKGRLSVPKPPGKRSFWASLNPLE